jgi:hypothetical protein
LTIDPFYGRIGCTTAPQQQEEPMPDYREPAQPTQIFVRMLQRNYAGSCGKTDEANRWITATWPNTPIVTHYVEIDRKDDIYEVLHRHVVTERAKYPECQWVGVEWVGDDLAVFVLLRHISVREGSVRLFWAEANLNVGGYDMTHNDGIRRFPFLRYERVIGHAFKIVPAVE